ncbi:MAG: beta-ketoacyl-ACP synthase II [Gammaproteobacteria bacterium]|nr:beta-ketoacyl-ACP synthase II [Gammaproteobacteria bacterium]
MKKRRVVVTGLGMVTPLGKDVETTWQSILAGKSGISFIDHFDTQALPVHFGGTIKEWEVTPYLSPSASRKMDLFIQYGLVAAISAIANANLNITPQNAERIGIAIGSGIGGLRFIENNHTAYCEGGYKKVSPFFVPGGIINMIAGNLSILCGAKGPNLAISTACSTGLHNIGESARIIQYGDADVMISGGAEMGTCPMGLAGFCATRALSTRNEKPEAASRPWDKGRDGFVLADGAGILVLEEKEHALRRGAKIHAELLGYGLSGDAYHITTPPPGGEGAARAMQNALKDARLSPKEVHYINAHATSTIAGDIAETRAVKSVFGKATYDIPISSTKSMTGHLLGAAGAVEAIFCILALRDQIVPPTINLEEADPECDLDYVPNVARPHSIARAMSNSFGFGGTNGTLIFGG